MAKIAIVGGGISGLSLAHFTLQKSKENEITIFEAENIGGVVQSEKVDNCIFEHGPETYQARHALLHKLATDLKIENQLVKADSASAKRFLIKEGRILKIPTGPVSFFFNSILFFPSKFRAFGALKKSYSVWRGMSLFDACKHVFGQQFAEYFGSVLSRGIFGCEAEDLEFAGAFPEIFTALNENEKSQNSLSLKKLVKKIAEERKSYWQTELGDSYANFEKGLYTFKEGLQFLTINLRNRLKEQSVKFESVKIGRFATQGKQYTLQTKSQKYGPYDKVIFTCSAHELSHILKDFKKEISVHLNKMQYSPITTVMHAFKRKDFNAQGFGFLAPRKEKLPIFGTLFSSNIFPFKAPKDYFLTKTMIAGDTKLFSDEEVSKMALEGLKRSYKVTKDPQITRIARFNPGIPKYFLGYSQWKEDLEAMLKPWPGFYTHGWTFQGVGLAHSLEASYKLAKKIIKE